MKQIYTIDIYEALQRFRAYHFENANTAVPSSLHEEYFQSLVEQMIAHFDVEAVAVQSFVAHYTTLLTDPNVSPLYRYHPLKFLRQMPVEGYLGYAYCLSGFAEEMFHHLQYSGLFVNGHLIASFDRMQADTLNLMVRPGVSDVFLYS